MIPGVYCPGFEEKPKALWWHTGEVSPLRVAHFSGSTCCQLVICGDFLQLPPVPDMDGRTSLSLTSKFAFAADTWARCMGQPMILRQVFRQKDQGTVDLLDFP